jgi:hypothetical protein
MLGWGISLVYQSVDLLCKQLHDAARTIVPPLALTSSVLWCFAEASRPMEVTEWQCVAVWEIAQHLPVHGLDIVDHMMMHR